MLKARICTRRQNLAPVGRTEASKYIVLQTNEGQV